MRVKCIHILKISIIGCTYYFFVQMMIALFGDSHGGIEYVWERIEPFFNSKAIIEWVVFNQDPFINIMWFTFALLYCYLFIWLFAHIEVLEKLYFFIPVLCGAHLILGNLLPIFGIVIAKVYYRNFFLFGMPFVLLGVWIRNNETLLCNKMKKHISVLCMVIGIFLSILEWFLIGRHEMFLGSIIFAMGAFCYALHCPQKKKSSFISIVGRRYSLFIYIVHMSITIVADRIIYGLFVKESIVLDLYANVKPIFIFLLSCLGAVIYDYFINVFVRRKKKMSAN